MEVLIKSQIMHGNILKLQLWQEASNLQFKPLHPKEPTLNLEGV